MQIDGVKSLKEPHLYNGIAITYEFKTFPVYEHENFPKEYRKYIYIYLKYDIRSTSKPRKYKIMC